MSMYINGTGAISPQQTFDKNALKTGFVTFDGNRWPCCEPDYSQYIDPKQIRRMSRIIRMGIVSSLLATRESGVEKPDAIIVGTAFGCLEDTYAFLSKMVQYKEDMLSPTAFIHSTHNTIAAQIALLFQSRGYNSTYVHRALSFESSLIDAMMLIEENAADNVLVGGIDEITDASFSIMDRMGFYKETSVIQKSNIYKNTARGTAAGEGAAFFSVSGKQHKSSYARITGVEIFSFISPEELILKAKGLLQENGISLPDLLITGHNGEGTNDHVNDNFAFALNCNDRIIKYKHWCGEYNTCTAFATWLAAEVFREKRIPGWLSEFKTAGDPVRNILIYNQQEGQHHSLILLSAC